MGHGCLYLLIVTIICYFQALAPGRTFLPADLTLLMPPWRFSAHQMFPDWHAVVRPVWDPLFQFYAARKLMADAISQGYVPWHDPYKFSGTPFIADGQSAFFYPINWLFAIVPLASAFGVVAALHTFFAGLFFVMFMRRRGIGWEGSLIGATTWMFCGTMVSWQMWQVVDSTLCWLPLGLYFADRICRTVGSNGKPRRPSCVPMNFAGLGATIGMILLAGHAQFAIYSIGVIFAYMLVVGDEKLARRGIFAVCTVALGGLIASVQLLPQADLLRNSLRGNNSVSDLIATSMPASQLGMLFMPDILGGMRDWQSHSYNGAVNYWELTSYIGVASFVLALFSYFKPKVEQKSELILWSAIAIIGLLIGLGTPLVNLLYVIAPALKSFHGLARTLILTEFSIAILASFGMQKLMELADDAEAKSGFLKCAGASAFICVALYGIAASRTSPVMSFALTHEWLGYGLTQLGKALLVIAITYVAGVIVSPKLRSLMVIVVAVDSLVFASVINPGSDSRMLFPKLPAVSSMIQTAGAGRVICVEGGSSIYTLIPNTAEIIGLHDVSGSDPLLLANYDQFMQKLNTQTSGSPEPNGMGIIPKFSHAGLDYLNVDAVISPEPLADSSLHEIYAGPDIYIYSNPAAHGEAWLENPGGADANDPSYQALLGGNVSINLSGSDHIESIAQHPESVIAKVTTSKSETLVFSEIADNGWHAKLDGQPVSWQSAHGLLVSLPVPSGEHTVTLDYLPDSGKVGLYFSCIGWMAIVWIVSWQIASKRFSKQYS